MKEYLVTYNTDLEVDFARPTAVGQVNFQFLDSEYGDEIYANGSAPDSPGNYTLTLPGLYNDVDRTYKVNVFYTNASSELKSEQFFVRARRPYITADDLASELGLTIDASPSAANEITREKLEQLERYAYTRINALTLANFNSYFVRRPFEGNGKDYLAYDDPILAVEKVWINGDLSYDIEDDLWIDGLVFESGDGGSSFHLKYVDTDNVIVGPDAYSRFIPGYEYKIQFIAGYANVPEDIRQAAALLANDFLCNDYGQRNHYVAKAENQFGKVEYFPNAFRGTGNVSVDQLLMPYMRLSMQVV